MPIRDNSLVVRLASDGAQNGTATEGFWPAAGLDIEGTGLSGMALHVILPQCDTTITAAAMKITVYAGSASTITTAASSDGAVIVAQRSGLQPSGEYVIPFSTELRCVAFGFTAYTNASGAASGGFTDVTAAWVTLNYGQDFSRIVEFH